MKAQCSTLPIFPPALRTRPSTSKAGRPLSQFLPPDSRLQPGIISSSSWNSPTFSPLLLSPLLSPPHSSRTQLDSKRPSQALPGRLSSLPKLPWPSQHGLHQDRRPHLGQRPKAALLTSRSPEPRTAPRTQWASTQWNWADRMPEASLRE